MNYNERIASAVSYASHYKRIKRMREKPRQSHIFWPSEASVNVIKNGVVTTYGKCGRATYYSMRGVIPSSDSLMSIKKMRLGELVGQMEVEFAHTLSSEVHDEIPISIPGPNGLIISGRIDMIIKDDDTGLYDIVENKSAYGYRFESETQKKGLYSESYAMQIGEYMYGIRVENALANSDVFKLDRSQVQNGILRYTSRGNCDQAPDIYVDFDSDTRQIYAANKLGRIDICRIDNIFQKMTEIRQHVEQRTLPPRDFMVSADKVVIKDLVDRGRLQPHAITAMTEKDIPWQCSYCPYKVQCASNVNAPEDDAEIQKIQEKTMMALDTEYISMYGKSLAVVPTPEVTEDNAND